MIEIERKFLVKSDAFINQATTIQEIRQGYISKDPARSVRIRIIGDKGWLTIKGPTDPTGIERFEFEESLSGVDARHLFKLCLPGAIHKTRYLATSGNLTFEVDIFHGENAGLTVAELELPTRDTPFEKPDWLGKEVTGDKRYYNAYLSDHPFKTW